MQVEMLVERQGGILGLRVDSCALEAAQSIVYRVEEGLDGDSHPTKCPGSLRGKCGDKVPREGEVCARF